MSEVYIETEVTAFFRERFPEKDLELEKECGYFQRWVDLFRSGAPEEFMDDVSLRIYAILLMKKIERVVNLVGR